MHSSYSITGAIYVADVLFRHCFADIIIAPSSDEKVSFVGVRWKTPIEGEKGFLILVAGIVICFLAEIVGDTEVKSRLNNDNVRQWAIVNRGIGVVKG